MLLLNDIKIADFFQTILLLILESHFYKTRHLIGLVSTSRLPSTLILQTFVLFLYAWLGLKKIKDRSMQKNI